MRRREFTTLLGGTAAAWPLAALAQQSQKVRRIGAMINRPAGDPEAIDSIAAFSQGLGGAWVERWRQCADRISL